MNREYDIFLLFPNGTPVLLDHVQGLQTVHEQLAILSKMTKNECFAQHAESKEVVARVNVKGK